MSGFLPGDKLGSAKGLVDQLAETQILSHAEISEVIEGLPPQDPLNAQNLAKALVRKRKITKYQAKAAFQGKAKSLKIGEYVVLDRLGEGGMGQVLKARHTTMDRVVALKLLHRKLTGSESMVKRFRQEVRAAAKLMHPNIVGAFDAGQHKGVHFLVMEFVEGKDLSAIIRDDGKFSIADAMQCILQAARGLAYAHEKGIVHRDIKPANLLLGGDGVLKILDMGLARITTESEVGLTKAGQVMGTADYMPPEQQRDTRAVDARGDIYSLGCTLYKLLTGKTLFKRDTIVSTMVAHQSAPIPSLLDVRPDAPPELNEIFQRMVAKSIDERPESMAEVVQFFEKLTESGSTSAELNARLRRQPIDDDLTEFFAQLEKSDESTVAPEATKANTRPATAPTLPSQGGSQGLLIGGGFAGCLVLGLAVVLWAVSSQNSDPHTVPVPVPDPAPDEVPQINFQHERRVAERVLATPGGYLELQLAADGQIRKLIGPALLPNEPFYVLAISWTTKPTEEEWEQLSKLGRLKTLGFDRSTVDLNDDDVAKMMRFKWRWLKNLTICAVNKPEGLTDSAIISVSRLKELDWLSVFGGALKDDSLKAIASMEDLGHLQLSQSDRDMFSAAGFEHFAVARDSRLHWIDLIGEHLDDAKFAAIVKLRSLETLTIRGSWVGPVGLASLEHAPGLKKLSLFQQSFSQPEVAAIVRHARPQLSVLEFRQGAGLTDEALEELAKMPYLKELLLENCGRIRKSGTLAKLVGARRLETVTLKDIVESSVIDAKEKRLLEQAREEDPIEVFVEGPPLRSNSEPTDLRIAPDPPPTSVPDDGESKSADRLVAESIIRTGGEVVIDEKEKDRLSSIDALPGSRFRIREVYIAPRFPKLEAEWKRIAELEGLKVLHSRGGLGDAQLELVADSTSLEELRLEDADVTSAGLASLAKAKSLTSLHVLQNRFGDREVEALAVAARQLKGLKITAAELTDLGMKNLEKLKSLEELHLVRCGKVRDKGLMPLATIRTLRKLTFSDTPPDRRITSYGIDDLKAARVVSRPLGPLVVEAAEITQSILSRGLAEIDNEEDLRAHVASCVYEKGGFVAIKQQGDTAPRSIHNPRDLPPKDEYKIAQLYIYNWSPRNRAEWTCLARLPNLQFIGFQQNVWLSDHDAARIAEQSWPKLDSIQLCSDDRLTDKAIDKIKTMSGLRSLSVNGGSLTNRSFETIGEMHSLAAVGIKNIVASPRDYETLCAPRDRRKRRTFEQLTVEGVGFNNDHMAVVGRSANLKRLGLFNTGVTHVGFRKLKDCKQLNRIEVRKQPFGDDEFVAVGSAPALETLLIPASQLTDPGVARAVHKLGNVRGLGKRRSFNKLELDNCAGISDIGLAHLVKLAPLTLTLKHTPKEPAFTPEGLTKLAQTPGITVIQE